MTLYDNSIVSSNDLSFNFFARKEDVSNYSRADVTQRGLMEINYSAIVMTFKGELSNDISILNDYQILIITEIINFEMAEALNQYCRNNRIGFIYTAEFGLSSFFFNDFGEDFITEDLNGEECKKYFIKSITNDCPGIVEIDPIEITDKSGVKTKKYLKLGTGDFVTFKDVTGMTELNDTPPRPIYVLSPTKFSIEDTSKFQEFTGLGIVEEVKVPRMSIFRPLSEAINSFYYEDIFEDYLTEDFGSLSNKIINENNDDNIIEDDENLSKKSKSDKIIYDIKESNNNNNNNIPSWIKMFYSSYQNENMKNFVNEKMHLVNLTLHEFLNMHESLPNFNNKKEIDECIEISEKILSKYKEDGSKWAMKIRKKDVFFLEKIFKSCRFFFTPFTCFFAGIVAEEIIKYTGLYKPSSQWIYFNTLDLINDDDDNDNEIIIDKKSNNNNKIINGENKQNIDNTKLFGKEIINELKNINILIIGLNDIGYEILKMFLMLGLLNNNGNGNGKGDITVLNDNEDEVDEVDEKINDLKNRDNFNNINLVNENIDINMNITEKDWWKKANIVINTHPYNFHSKEKLYIIKNSKKSNKVLIDINANKTIAFYELFLPKQLINNKKDDLCFYEAIETPEGPDDLKKENNANSGSDKNDEKNNIINLEENDDEDIGYHNISTLKESFNWSKDFFEKHFNLYIKYLNEIIKISESEEETNKYIDNLTSKEKDDRKILQLIRTFKKFISLKLGMNYETIVFHSIETFQELFEFSVEEILQKYPSDLIDEKTNNKYWFGARKEPKKIIFDINNEEHFQFIYCMTYLLCEIMEIDEIDTKMKNIKKAVEKYELKKFDNTALQKIQLKDFYDIEKFSLLQFLKGANKKALHLKELEINYKDNNEDFDSLENMNKQLKLVILASNIKLSIFGLNESNKNNAICSILKFNNHHPMVSSAISGLVVTQLFNLFNDSKFFDFIKEGNNIINDNNFKNNQNKINDINDRSEDRLSCYRNAIFNLASNIYLLFELNNC